MTPDQAHEKAKFQRPGVRLVVGPTEAREEFVKPLIYLDLKDLPGDFTWFDYDTRKRFGRPFSLWESIQISYTESCAGRELTDDEILWIMEKNRSLADMRKLQSDFLEDKRRYALLGNNYNWDDNE